MNDSDNMRAIADEHAARDWRAGKRWQCRCDACTQARGDGYEPKSTIHVVKGARKP